MRVPGAVWHQALTDNGLTLSRIASSMHDTSLSCLPLSCPQGPTFLAYPELDLSFLTLSGVPSITEIDSHFYICGEDFARFFFFLLLGCLPFIVSYSVPYSSPRSYYL